MIREQLIKEAKKVQNIVNTGKLTMGNRVLDISVALGMYSSREYRQDDIEDIDITRYEKSNNQCKFTILPDGSDSVVFNKRYKTKDERYLERGICVLNFASSKNPGGGFLNGAMAQEEALCQSSNLYNILSKHKSFYEYNREHLNNGQYTDGIIFTEKCLFFRKNYVNVEPQLVDVITCAAPNFNAARRNGVSVEEIECTMSRRIEQILKVAIANNVKVLALGAFGCGVFGNNPDFVASVMRTILCVRGYADYFEEIIFPMNGSMGENVRAFNKIFNKLI